MFTTSVLAIVLLTSAPAVALTKFNSNQVAGTARDAAPLPKEVHHGHAEATAERDDQNSAVDKKEDDDNDFDDDFTDDLFGFTIGSDINEKGEVEISSDVVGSFRHYRSGVFKSTFEYTFTDRFSMEIGATANGYSIRNVPDLENRNTAGFGGLSAELKYQIFKRCCYPFGLTLITEPEIGFLDEQGERVRSFGLETRLALDTEIIPKTLYAAFNLIFEAERTRPRGFQLYNAEEEDRVAFVERKAVERESLFGLSGALAFQALPGVFFGGELRYMRAYEGLGLNGFEGDAFFAGLTSYTQFGKNLSLSAAWSTQITGSAKGERRGLNLNDFPRNEAKLSVIYQF